jgi:hypothetical protein
MKIDLTQANIRLEPQRELSLMDAADVEVTCLTGCVWLTTAGDPRDIILLPGDAHSIKRNGDTIINALESSLVHVRMPSAQRSAWKRWLEPAWRWLRAPRRHGPVLSRGLNY